MAKEQNNQKVVPFRSLGGRPARLAPELADGKNFRTLNQIRVAGAKALSDAEENNKPLPELTPQEEDFCQYVAAGFSFKTAAQKAQGEQTIQPTKTFLSKPRIAARINQLLEEQKNTAINDAERIRRFIQTRLEEEATEAKEGATRMKALEMLGKIPTVRAFEENVSVAVSERSNPEDIKKLLEEKLRAFTKKA